MAMKGKLANIALFFGSIILVLLVIEVTLRAYHGEWRYTNFRFPYANKFDGLHIYDTELGWVPKQGQVDGWETTVKILAAGVRSNGRGEIWDETDNPILAVGDSFTFGDGVRDSETWPAQLEQLSERRVINGGVDGYGLDQTYLRARHLISSYRFGILIFSFIPDDIRRSQMSVMWGTAKPYFDFRDGLLTLENVPVPAPSSSSEKNPLVIALEHSRLVHAVMKRVYGERWQYGSIQVLNDKRGEGIACALLHELEGLSKSRGFDLIVLAQYHKHEITWQSTAVAQAVLGCLTDPATRILDLKTALTKLSPELRSSYYGPFTPPQHWSHMTPIGNEFVAHEILKVLPPGEAQVNRALFAPTR